MLPGPVFQVELLTLARRRRNYALRFAYGLLLLYLVGVNLSYLSWSGGGGGLSIQRLAGIGTSIFTTFAFTQAFVVLLITPALVAGVVADERQRKTLGYLLASTLTSGEIVLGKLAARMLSVGVFLAVGLPVVSLLSFFGGVDPNHVMLYFAGSVSTAFLLAAGAVAVSVHARRPREAVLLTYLGEFAWLFGPSIVEGVLRLPGWWPGRFFEWLRPLNDLIGASSPYFVFVNIIFRGRANPALYETVFGMIATQVVFAAALSALAVARLRPIIEGRGESIAVIPARGPRRSWPVGVWPRPRCGDDPVGWKELHVVRTSHGLARGSSGPSRSSRPPCSSAMRPISLPSRPITGEVVSLGYFLTAADQRPRTS